jgi:hypothetical protein
MITVNVVPVKSTLLMPFVISFLSFRLHSQTCVDSSQLIIDIQHYYSQSVQDKDLPDAEMVSSNALHYFSQPTNLNNVQDIYVIGYYIVWTLDSTQDYSKTAAYFHKAYFKSTDIGQKN